LANKETRLGENDLGDLPVLSDEQIAERESANGIRQFDRMLELIRENIGQKAAFRLGPQVLVELNALAVDGLEPTPGAFRTIPITIQGSRHVPPDWRDIPALLDEMCGYVNSHWESATALHLAAYCMWRVNWVHPFVNGNGRTSRAVSYLVLSVHLGSLLPGRPMIPELIDGTKREYYQALDRADKAARYRRTDVSAMEALLQKHLAAQLMSALRTAGAGLGDGT